MKKSDQYQMEPYEALANAIIVQAADDYHEYTKKLRSLQKIDTSHMDEKAKAKYDKKLEKAETAIDEVIDFFYSEWYAALTTIDPELILLRLSEECEEL